MPRTQLTHMLLRVVRVYTLANLCALLWWIRHTEAGYYANVVGIMLDVVDTPYRGGVLCLRGGALCSASVWRIHHIKHNTPPR